MTQLDTERLRRRYSALFDIHTALTAAIDADSDPAWRTNWIAWRNDVQRMLVEHEARIGLYTLPEHRQDYHGRNPETPVNPKPTTEAWDQSNRFHSHVVAPTKSHAKGFV